VLRAGPFSPARLAIYTYMLGCFPRSKISNSGSNNRSGPQPLRVHIWCDWLPEWARPDPTRVLTTLETVIGYMYVIGVACTRGYNLDRKPPVNLHGRSHGDASVRPSQQDQAEASRTPSSPQTNHADTFSAGTKRREEEEEKEASPFPGYLPVMREHANACMHPKVDHLPGRNTKGRTQTRPQPQWPAPAGSSSPEALAAAFRVREECAV
jgi:hypothetical protein